MQLLYIYRFICDQLLHTFLHLLHVSATSVQQLVTNKSVYTEMKLQVP
jgi:hypothetical protein